MHVLLPQRGYIAVLVTYADSIVKCTRWLITARKGKRCDTRVPDKLIGMTLMVVDEGTRLDQ